MLKGSVCHAFIRKNANRVLQPDDWHFILHYSLQPTAYSLQPTAYSLQPTAYSLQPTAYSRLAISMV